MRNRCNWPCATGVSATISPISVTMPVNISGALVDRESVLAERFATTKLQPRRGGDRIERQCVERRHPIRTDRPWPAQQPDFVGEVGCDKSRRHPRAAFDQ